MDPAHGGRTADALDGTCASLVGTEWTRRTAGARRDARRTLGHAPAAPA